MSLFLSFGKSWEGYLQRILNMLLSSRFPHGARQQNNSEIKTFDLRNPSSPKECLECWEGCDIFSTSHLDNSLLLLTLSRFAPDGGKIFGILVLFSLSVSLGMGGGGTPSHLSCAGNQAGNCCDSFCSLYLTVLILSWSLGLFSWLEFLI